MIGTTLAHYRITGELGAGGMGEVWRAQDTKLGRDVALKVLSEEFADDAERLERFEREARAVASLNHPHIVTIFSVEEAEGVRFLTMELIEGRSLDKMIPDEGLDLATFLEMATPLAEAISAAHDKSVIHRDLKPSNVMIDGENRVKVLDFGLAKLQGGGEESDSSELPTEALTGVGMIVGTVPYMSPEQIEGKIVDHRTDIFSLGILLYEMALGERPFQGDSQPALMSSILRDVPQSVVDVRDDVPRHLGRIIGRCLEKDRRDRYQTARDVFNELKALHRESSSTVSQGPRVASGSSRSIPSVSSSSAEVLRGDVPWVVVSPFSYRGNDQDLETFADGLEEDITAGLSRFSYLSVIASDSARQRRGKAVDFRWLAEELGARFVIQGRIRAAAGTIRVTVQVVDAVTETHLWSETHDRSLDEAGIFEVQDEVTDMVVATVADSGGVLVRSINDLLRSKSPEECTATDWVVRTFVYWSQLREDVHSELRNGLELAVEREPNRSAIWACLSQVYLDEHRSGFNPRDQPLQRALRAALTAVELNPRDSLALESLADVYFFLRDLTSFRLTAEKALAINPRDATTMASMGMWLALSGELERGCELAHRAMELNQEHAGWYHFAPYFHHFHEGRFEEALTSAKSMTMPDFCWSHMMVAAAAGKLGLEADGRAAATRLRSFFDDPAEDARREAEKFVVPEGLLAEFLDGLQKAGLEIDGAGGEAINHRPPKEPSAAETSDAVAIAVLPFTNMSADRENDYFSDGLSEEIINTLTRLSGLRVIARSSAFRFRGEQDLRKVGEALSVRNVLEGSVRKAGERLRITAQLIDVTDDSHVWSEHFDRELTDVFEIQDEIAGAIVEKLDVSLAADEPVRRQTANVEAYDALLEGRHHFSQFTPEAVERALACFERALSLDPDYADALAFFAFYHLMNAYMFENPREMLPKTREFAEMALQVDSNHGEAQAAVAVVEVMLDQDWSANERLFQRALEMAPASARVHELYGLCCLLGGGRFDEALAELDLALKLDPLSALYAGNRGRVLTCSRRFAEAQESCRRGLVLDSRQLLVQVELTYALLFDGKLEEAIAVGERAIETHGPVNAPRQALALSYAVAGRRDEAFELVTDEPGAGYRSPLARGLVHAAFDEMDEAFACVEQSFEERDPLLIYINVHPMFDTLRADPRFATLVEHVGLPPSPGGPTASKDSGPSQPVEKSIVVLPFDNLSSDPDTEYFSDGLTDEIITDLSQVRALRVISRSSAMRLKDDERGLAAIGRDLDCRYVLEGSVRRAANDLRITARLVDAADDSQLWSDKYEGTLDDVFDIQERVSRSIVDALEIRLTPHEAEQLAERPIPDVRAQECYLRARREIWSFLPGGVDKAVSHLEAGLALIGDNALLYQGLGEAYFQAINIGAAGGREEEYITKAERCAEKIFALEPDSPRGSSVRAHLQLARGDIHGCRRSWRRVLQAYPKDVQALQLSAHILGWLGGKPDAAAPLVARLLDIDPLDPMSRLMSVTVPLFAGRFSEALEPGRRMFDLDPVTPVWRSNYVMALSYARQLDEAEALTEGVVAQPDSDIGTWWMGLCRAAWREDRSEVLRLTDGPYRQAAAWDAEIPWALASAHAAVGAKDEALLWLDRAIDQGMINYPFLTEHDHYLDSIRGDERFGRSMERARREWERFDV